MHLHKTWLCTTAAFFVLLFQATSQDAQETAIKKAIADQNTALIRHDADAWKSSWLQDDKASSIITNFFGSTFKTGWDKVSEDVLKYFKNNPTPDSMTITTDSFNIRREGNMAVVDYKQELKFLNGVAPFDKFSTREQRVMVKKNGKWLVTGVTSNNISGLGLGGVELSMNATGYNYLFAGKTDEAIKVLELNTVLFPESFNVWDSLGEAYAKAGDKEKARACYEKSVALNPANDSGKKALNDLK